MQKEVTTSFEEIPPQELNEWFQKFYLSARKRDGCLVIAHQNYKCYELKNIIFALNYFTVLVYAKTIFHLATLYFPCHDILNNFFPFTLYIFMANKPINQ